MRSFIYHTWCIVAAKSSRHLFHIMASNNTYSRWVKDSFKHILTGACDEYFQTDDRGNDKTRSKFLARITKEIEDFQTEAKEKVPDNLRKVRAVRNKLYPAV